jgi:hypothetical protein
MRELANMALCAADGPPAVEKTIALYTMNGATSKNIKDCSARGRWLNESIA